MHGLAAHLPVLPILIPLITGAVLVLFDDRQRTLKAIISFTGLLILLTAAIAMVVQVSQSEGVSTISYAIGNWPVPFGIVLVADRLSAMMVLLATTLGLATLVYSLARWHTSGPSFHSLMHFLIMGLNGAFLTGDIFNLFVFFEVMLAASYGLALHGGGSARVKAGLHYVAINLAASFLFLIGAALIYGVTGTLNMADLAMKVAMVPAADRGLMEMGAAVLAVAFLIKAGTWPLGFWLPATYSVAAPPVAAIFAIMTKVGIYALLRLSTLAFGTEAGASQGFGQIVLLCGGMATIVFGVIGLLASRTPGRMASYSVLVSAGTLLASIGIGNPTTTGGALYYLVVSTLAVSAFFMLIELMDRVRIEGANVLALTLEVFGDDDEEAEEEVGLSIPGALAMLSISFCVSALLLAGFPPLAGFLAKFAIISSLFNPEGLTETGAISPWAWGLAGLMIFSGFATLIALMREGINTFWATLSDTPGPVRVLEMMPVALLLGIAVGMTIMAAPVMDYMQAAAEELYLPGGAVTRILETPLVVSVEAVH
ncbi:monovalent cation/H+ antiporter subunit D [Devosia sp. FJ2-5-3]|uniref:monovalent cation/H+ antiporter subunit D n=1 Tax=Devosia sp. FJ2-5-3 TaxID=2976680 RepID=UPI0023D8ACBE|nr:monovalent cation/H+ antiporter subunit D [Devosia sp. FJ2-5-3]WEJ58224.1 monovalent cation/H+ antiporter subunit D [Devosia sp. FJ2-5-3]